MTLYLAALAILAAGALAGPLLSRRPALALSVGSALAVVGSLVGLAAVLPFLLGAPPAEQVLPWSEPLGAFHLRLDPLAAFFQVALFAVAVPASAFGANYMRPSVGRRPLGAFVFFYGTLLVAISLVLASADGVLFLVAWEVMTIASFALVTFDDEKPQVRSAGFVFLVASHVGTAFLFALFLLLGRAAGGFDFVRFEALRGAGAGAPWLLFALGLVGFGTKAGLVPLHVWLPEAHPAAPSHVSALLSGVMIKTGVYGILRLTGFLPPLGVGHGLLLGAIGLGSAVVAITLTLGQGDLKKALAYSSVENVGLILLGVGLAVAAGAAGHPVVAALGMGGALFHVWNHALMKGLAFLGAGTLVHAAHSQDLEKMGGLLARLPFTGALFLVGAASLAALPPLSGFASEWLLYLGLLRSGATAASGATALLAYLAVAVLALVGALAAISFTRIAGVALLGAPRGPEAARPHEVGPAAGCRSRSSRRDASSSASSRGSPRGWSRRWRSSWARPTWPRCWRRRRPGGGAPGRWWVDPARGRRRAPRLAARLRSVAPPRNRGCGFTPPRAHGVHRLLPLPAPPRRSSLASAPAPPPPGAPRHLPGQRLLPDRPAGPGPHPALRSDLPVLGDCMSRLRRFQARRLNLQRSTR